MIATCPACGKRYRIPDEAVPVAGRSVRCSACGHGWTAFPDTPPPFDPAPRLPFAEPQPRAAPPEPPRYEPPTQVASAFSSTPDDDTPPRRRRRAWRWIVPSILVLAAAGALAVVEFAPAATFSPPRLGLPAVDLPPVTLPAIDLPPLDLTRIPVIGDRLDALVHPVAAPASPLRIVVTGERRRLGNGSALLVLSGTITNPTDVPQPVPAIDARLVGPAERIGFRWRIAAPVAVLPAHGSVPFDSTAANYPADAERLDLAFAAR